jgi:hypothetical protein
MIFYSQCATGSRRASECCSSGNKHSSARHRPRRRVCRTLALIASLCWLAASDAKEPAICAKLPATVDPLAGTPRADSNLESLALSLSDGIAAAGTSLNPISSDPSARAAAAA